jgi:hypothetical protein
VSRSRQDAAPTEKQSVIKSKDFNLKVYSILISFLSFPLPFVPTAYTLLSLRAALEAERILSQSRIDLPMVITTWKTWQMARLMLPALPYTLPTPHRTDGSKTRRGTSMPFSRGLGRHFMNTEEREMHLKRLAVVCSVLAFVMFLGSAVVLADDLADVQKKIKDKNLKWVAEHLPSPEKKGLGLLKDGFTSLAPSVAGEGELLTSLLPASVDWRNIGADNLLGVMPGNYVPRVKNQGSCGSCWAFATTAIAESASQIASDDPIEALDPGSAYNLSEEVMLNCSGAGSCNGGYVTTASNYAATTGLLRENPAGCYGYDYSTPACPVPSSYPACDQSRYRIDSWSGVSATVDAMKSALNSHGPLVTTYAVYNDFYRYYSSGVYEATSCDQTVNPLVGYHAVALVGYRDADATNPVGYFIVKNSWGTAWGEMADGSERGYFRIGYSQVGNCVKFGGSTLAYSKIACNGTISVDSPVEADIWQAGTTQTISWNATGSVGQYGRIDLYQTGKLIRTIQSNAPLADRSYQWVVDSDLEGSGYSVTITSTVCGSASGTSGQFAISPAANFSASGLVSSGGTGLPGATISFGRVSGTGLVPAPVSTDAGGNWTQTGFMLGTGYRATPSKPGCSFSPAFLDFADANTSMDFSMTENKLVAVTSPDAGSSWKAGSTHSITWAYTGSPGSYVAIDLIDNTTGAKTTINSRVKLGSGGVGSYSWRISKQQAARSYRVKVTSTTNGSSATSPVFGIIK